METTIDLAQAAIQVMFAGDSAFLHNASPLEEFSLGLGVAQENPALIWQWLEQELEKKTTQGFIAQKQNPLAAVPPFYSIVAWNAWKKNPSQARVEQIFDALLHTHQYWYIQRDPQELGLPSIHFPEEAFFLSFNPSLTPSIPFQIQDPGFLGLLCRANECLIEMAQSFNLDPGELIQWNELTVFGLNEDLWDDSTKTYFCYDLKADKKMKSLGLSQFLPLWGGVPDQEQAEGLCRNLIKRHFKEDFWSLPIQSPDFIQPEAIATEKVSPCLNRLIYVGLLRYGFKESARFLKESTLEMVKTYGFHNEYQALMDPYAQIGLGKGNAAATAGIIVDLIKGTGVKKNIH